MDFLNKHKYSQTKLKMPKPDNNDSFLSNESNELPIDRPDLNFLVVGSNFGNKKNLKNVILLELSFMDNFEDSLCLQSIDNLIVDRTFLFSVNVVL